MRSILWRNLLFFGALAALSCVLRAGLPDGVATEPPPAWVVPVAPASAGQPKPNPSGQDFLLLDRQINVATGETYDRRAFQIVSDEGRRNGGQVSISFDPSYQTLTLHHLHLVRDGRIIDKLDPDRVQLLQQERDLDRQLYNGERSALVILEDLRVGDVVDLAYTIHGCNPVFAGRFIDVVPLGWGVPVSELRCRVLTPDNRAIHHQIRGESRPEFSDTPTAGGRELLWVCRNLPALDADVRTPSWHVVYPFLELTEFASWREVVDWAVPLYTTGTDPSPAMAGVLAQITKEAKSEDSRIVAALNFVQQEIRYLGIELGAGSHRPSTPDEVLQRRFGDCKDKARLLSAILRHLGFDAAPALVHSYRRHTVQDWLPSPFAFDHVVVAVNRPEKQTLVLDPTQVYQCGSTAELRHTTGFSPILQLAPGNDRLVTVPSGAGDFNRIEIRETYRVTAIEAPAELQVQTTYRSAAANQMRAWFAANSMEQVMRQYTDFYTRYYPELDARQVHISKADDTDKNVLEITETYRIPHLFVPPASGTVFKAEFYPAVLSDYVRTPNLRARRHPLSQTHPVWVTSEIDIHLPSVWQVEPTSRKIEDRAFSFAYELKRTGTTLHLKYQWNSRVPEIPVDRLETFGANAKAANDLLGYQLTNNPAVATNGIFPLNWGMLALACLMLVLGGVAGRWLLLRRNPVPPDPPPLSTPVLDDPYSFRKKAGAHVEGLGGWLILVAFGLLLRPLLQIAALQKGLRGSFNQAVWDEVTNPASASHMPHYAVAAPIELGLSLALLLWGIILLIQFFRRSYLFPRTFQWYLGVQVAAAAIFIWTSFLVSSSPARFTPDTWTALFQTFFAALIWIPYFQLSRRVKNTFTR